MLTHVGQALIPIGMATQVPAAAGVSAKLSIARSAPTEQSVKANRTRGLQMPD
jgi:hypothetical protein